MEHRQHIITSSSLVSLSLDAADGSTNSSASVDRYLSVPPPPMPSVNATPLFPQDQLMKFLATVGALDAASPDLINPPIQLWNQLGDGLSELHQLPSLPSSDLPLVFSGDSSNERFTATPFPPPMLPPPFPSSNQKGKAMMKSKLERRRRSMMRDQIRILEGMMPGGEKMNTVAQVTAMPWMPSAHSGFSRGPFYPSDLASEETIGGLGRLNSTMVLDLFCKRGCCVMSAEQAAALRQAQMLLPGPDGTVGDWRDEVAESVAVAIGDTELNHGTGVVELTHTRVVMQEGVLCDVGRVGDGAPEGDSDAHIRYFFQDLTVHRELLSTHGNLFPGK